MKKNATPKIIMTMAVIEICKIQINRSFVTDPTLIHLKI